MNDKGQFPIETRNRPSDGVMKKKRGVIMRKVVVLALAMVLLVSTFAIAAPIDIDEITRYNPKYEYTIIVTDRPMAEAVLANMDSQGWSFLTVVKHKRKHFWYFFKPIDVWLNPQ